MFELSGRAVQRSQTSLLTLFSELTRLLFFFFLKSFCRGDTFNSVVAPRPVSTAAFHHCTSVPVGVGTNSPDVTHIASEDRWIKFLLFSTFFFFLSPTAAVHPLALRALLEVVSVPPSLLFSQPLLQQEV